jgi:putative N6-adenine-specific DNA methylase
MFTYQKTKRYFGQLADDLEALGCQELKSLGGYDMRPSFRGIYFSAEKADLYRIVYSARLFSRILAPLIRFDCHSTKYLYQTGGKISWMDMMKVEDTFAINANVSHSRIKHSQYAAQCLKDAIVDQFMNSSGRRPSVDTTNPDVRLNLHIQNNKATIALDIAGNSLHRRGYRQQAVEAPMQETVAAALIKMTDWHGENPLVDVMCGSGTIVAEALMHYCRIPAGLLRPRFGLAHMPDFNHALWQKIKSQADSGMRPLPADLINAGDEAAAAVDAAKTNINLLPQGDKVRFFQRRFQDIPKIENSTIVSNPPYGLRMKTGQDSKTFARELGDFLKQRCQGSTAYLYFGKREMIKSIGLRPTWKKPLKNGGLDGRLVKYELY